ncbi:vancomycin resistance protein [Neobacillus piezotolerans]|uniref:Vancomycin resistance protein n=1 Tax=Neobacillus piezotolerans TaxID=2259171 RepID=A0A3D8GQ48_9BACI|nr:VanW family protein [Neobacillus piezotolerans]RDU36613.1 vancomycin resistance protein [Neobacillus piezotolerans]
MNPVALRPKERSSLRIKLGKTYYISRRYLKWMLNRNKFAKTRQRVLLPYSAFGHQTPLLRKLQGVDMSYQYNKIKNLKLAIERLNGVIIQPGETFSYWKLIGNPTKKKGYVDGMVLHYGRFTKGTGGGLCQLSNLIYWMTLHTPLTVTERHRHSFDVFPDSNRTQPFGSGATCAYNYLDLQIENGTGVPYQLHVRLTDTHLVGEWRCAEPQLYSYHIYEKDHSITPAYWGGYIRHNELWRKAYNRQHKLVEEEFITENNAIMMYEPLLEQQSIK